MYMCVVKEHITQASRMADSDAKEVVEEDSSDVSCFQLITSS